MHPETTTTTDNMLATELAQYMHPGELVRRPRTYWIIEFFLTNHGTPTYIVGMQLDERRAVDEIIEAESRDNVRVVCAQLAYDTLKGGFYGDEE